MDDVELAHLRQRQNDTLEDLAHAIPAVAALVDSHPTMGPLADSEGEHELACRATAERVFERHAAYLHSLSELRVLDLVERAAAKLTGSPDADAAAASLASTTVPALRQEIAEAGAVGDAEARERELRDAAALVLAARALQNAQVGW
ncbi:MAG: hypothetical protein U0P45_15470 [Acidimicrobiales bacterium]